MLGRLALPCQVIGEAADGAAGLELICEKQPDIVITDIKMPLLDGVEMICQAIKRGIKSKVLVISGFDDYQYVRNAMKNGANDYLLKPISSGLLEKSIQQIMDQIEQERGKEMFLNDMQEQLKLKTADIQELKLEKLLAGDLGSEAEFHKIQRVIHKDSCFSVAIIENNQENLIKDSSSYKQLLKTVKEEIYEFCVLNQTLAVVARYKKQIVMIASHKDQADLELVYQELLRYATNKGRTASISVSSLGTELQQLNAYYGQAHLASACKIYIDRSQKLMNYSDLSTMTSSMNQIKGDVNSKIYQLVNVVELCDRKLVQQQAEELLTLLYEHRIPSYKILEVMETLVNTLDKMIVDLGSYQNADTVDLQFLEGVYNFNLYKQWCRKELENRLNYLQEIRRERNKKIVEQVRQYIHKHYMETLTLTDLADHVNLSPNYLSEVFRKEVGQTFIKYLINYRMQEAKHLLQNTDYKIYQVAELVGYKEVISFNRAFKNTVGLSPKEYGNRMK